MLSIGVVLFDGFELLDVFGPLEMLGMFPNVFSISLIAPEHKIISSRQGPKSLCDYTFNDEINFDVIFVPGGIGTRREVNNAVMTDWLLEKSSTATYVMSVCTGSALLAKAGVLNGIKATTNKRAYDWAIAQGKDVLWQPVARWVEDQNCFTSSGISAGIDMSLAFIEKVIDRKASEKAALDAEYIWNDNPNTDPFSR